VRQAERGPQLELAGALVEQVQPGRLAADGFRSALEHGLQPLGQMRLVGPCHHRHSRRQFRLALPQLAAQTVNLAEQSSDGQGQWSRGLQGNRGRLAVLQSLREHQSAGRQGAAADRRGPDFADARRRVLDTKFPAGRLLKRPA